MIKKEGGWDESENIIGRNASLVGGWHVPRISRLINPVKFFFVYIREKGVTESITWLCLKSIQSIFSLHKSNLFNIGSKSRSNNENLSKNRRNQILFVCWFFGIVTSSVPQSPSAS